jgi:ABC-2 type transport system permease protein
VLLSRTWIAGWGDILYGFSLFFITQPLTVAGIALFVLFSLLMATVLTAVRVLYHSLTFFFGNAEAFAGLAGELMISFMLYPGGIFKGGASVLLHSLVPVALIAYIPAELFVNFDWLLLGIVLGADALLVAAAVLVFRAGLKRYESGNLIGARM